MKTYLVKAVWMNGKDDTYSGPYSQTIGTVVVNDNENVVDEVQKIFDNWRKENPSIEGWKVRAWPELTQT